MRTFNQGSSDTPSAHLAKHLPSRPYDTPYWFGRGLLGLMIGIIIYVILCWPCGINAVAALSPFIAGGVHLIYCEMRDLFCDGYKWGQR
jgi:hypothetical protein